MAKKRARATKVTKAGVEKPVTASPGDGAILRASAEAQFADELATIEAADSHDRPPGWRLSPRAVRTFLLGSEAAPIGGKTGPKIQRKFFGDDPLVDRSIVTLAGARGLMLVGQPGTAKSMLSELLAAAISGTSGLTIQGTAGTTEDQIKYSWNYALLLSEGPTRRALVPAPLYRGLSEGKLVRFEEITRCPAEIQDTMISVMSDKVLHVPEFEGDDAVVHARSGFNVIATANTRDRGVHDMSAALRRRFNFETVHPIADRAFELELVIRQATELLRPSAGDVTLDRDAVETLVQTFSELRRGESAEGAVVEKPAAVMSTAEAVSVVASAGIDAVHFGDGTVTGEHLGRHMLGAVANDDPEDMKKFENYVDTIIKPRASKSPAWKSLYSAVKNGASR